MTALMPAANRSHCEYPVSALGQKQTYAASNAGQRESMLLSDPRTRVKDDSLSL